jgi:Polyketide cyclase / dehydrase and lipid transport
MKILKTCALILLLLPVLLLFVSLFLPSRYRVVRSVSMNASANAVFNQINLLKSWPEWTAWTQTRYPDMQITFSGPDSGAGAAYNWVGKSTGQGTLMITRSEPAKGIGYELSFENGKFKSQGAIAIETLGDHLNVTWSNGGDLGANPIARYFGLMMDRRMGPDFELGLANLKRKVEAARK